MIIGIIGFGSIGERHYKNIKRYYPETRIKILTKRRDIAPSKNTEIFCSTDKFFSGYSDIFFVTNETNKHAKTILRCLKYSPRALFVEKPLSDTLSGIPLIRKQVEMKNMVFFIGYCLQFHKSFLELKRLIQTKSVGDILYMRASAGQDLRTWRKGNYRKNYSYDSLKGGGVVLDLIHEINYPSWLMEEKINFVSGIISRSGLFDLKSEDIADGLFMTDTGKIVAIHQDYLQNPGKRSCEIIGTRGTILWDSHVGEIRIIKMGRKAKIIKVAKNKEDMYIKELSFFMEKVLANKGYNNLDEGVRDLKNALSLKKYGGKYF